MTDYSLYIPDLNGVIRIGEADFRELVELARRNERLFNAACSDLGLISEHLKLDPNDGGCDPIISAIEDIEGQRGALLAALERIVTDLSNNDDEGLIEHTEQMMHARAAIAKAKEGGA